MILQVTRARWLRTRLHHRPVSRVRQEVRTALIGAMRSKGAWEPVFRRLQLGGLIWTSGGTTGL